MFKRGERVRHKYKDIEGIVVGKLFKLYIKLSDGSVICDYEENYKLVDDKKYVLYL